VLWAYAEIVRILSAHERVQILCNDSASENSARDHLEAHAVGSERFSTHLVPTDRVWTRDTAPTCVHRGGGLELVNWHFDGWAKYDNYQRDRLVGAAIAKISGLARIEAVRPDGAPLILEGGAIECDGKGTVLATEECLLSTQQLRNPGLDRAGYEASFREYLGASQTIWLDRGCVGDDTHGHIDDVARFVAPGIVALAFEADSSDANHEASVANLARLDGRRDAAGNPLRVVKIPYPRPVIMRGQRLPASYLNFYIANGTVLVPTFNDVFDRVALNLFAELFRGRRVIGVHAVDLVWGLGTLHCLTQQQPALPA
jgi:agmatine deiminase